MADEHTEQQPQQEQEQQHQQTKDETKVDDSNHNASSPTAEEVTAPQINDDSVAPAPEVNTTPRETSETAVRAEESPATAPVEEDSAKEDAPTTPAPAPAPVDASTETVVPQAAAPANQDEAEKKADGDANTETETNVVAKEEEPKPSAPVPDETTTSSTPAAATAPAPTTMATPTPSTSVDVPTTTTTTTATNSENDVKNNNNNNNNSGTISKSSSSEDIDGMKIKTKRIRVTEMVYEVQRRKNIFSSFNTQSAFVDAHEKPTTKQAIDDRLPAGWKWESEWSIDLDVSMEKEGWEYASKWSGPWHMSYGTLHTIRRRRWLRNRVKDVPEDELKNMANRDYTIVGEEGIENELNKFTASLREAFRNVSLKSNRPNILLLGGSGAGKSSLVNAVFGKPLAEIGEGKPITQSYSKYSSENTPVVIYDSKGIEHGSIEEGFVADTHEFFRKLRLEPDLENHIHCVWYVIDLTQGRFQPFEAEFCKVHLKDTPIIFILNKGDTVSTAVQKTMKDLILSFNMPNCKGVYVTVSNCKNFDTKTCLECGSEKIRKRLKEGTCTIMCKECKAQTVLEKTSGIDDVARATVSCMPGLVKQVFALSQRAPMAEKEPQAKKLIAQAAHEASIHKSDTMGQKLAEMAAKLIVLYQVDMFTHTAKREIMRKFAYVYKNQKFSKKLSMLVTDFINGKNLSQAIFIVSGLEVIKAIYRFKRESLAHALSRFDHQNNEIDSTAAPVPAAAAAAAETAPSSSSSATNGSAAAPSDNEFDKLIKLMRIEMDDTEVKQVSLAIKRLGGSIEAYLAQVPPLFELHWDL